MPARKPLYYWDSCIFIAWLKDEKRPPREMEGVTEAAEKIHTNQATLMTSVFTRTEVLECTLSEEAKAKFADLFKKRNFQLVDLNSRIADLAHSIRDYYADRIRKGLDQKPGLTQNDSVHLATAIHYQADEFHTFDDGEKGGMSLLKLDGNVAGHPLKICKPQAVQMRFGF